MNANLCQRLAANAKPVCAHLLQRGKRQGPAWVAGSWAGDAGQSIRIVVAGKDVGHWRDQRLGGENGTNLIEVWARARGVDEATARAQAAEWLETLDAPTPGSTAISTEALTPVAEQQATSPKAGTDGTAIVLVHAQDEPVAELPAPMAAAHPAPMPQPTVTEPAPELTAILPDPQQFALKAPAAAPKRPQQKRAGPPRCPRLFQPELPLNLNAA